MAGDITGPDGWPDRKVGIREVAAVAILYDVDYPDPGYNQNYVINNDLKIDIIDVATVATLRRKRHVTSSWNPSIDPRRSNDCESFL